MHLSKASAFGAYKEAMGLQKFRADTRGETQKNGGIPYYTNWMGGPSLALIRNCKVIWQDIDIGPRTVYVRGEADTYFSIPAACVYKRKTITGYITTDEYVFRAHKEG